jgi:acetate---CoA ligase (ADP-forming)
MQLHTLFDPRSVAIIGAASDPHKVGYALMKNVLAGGARDVYPISLNETEILGHTTYQSIKEVSGPVDLAIIAVRADVVASVLRECAEKGIKSVVVISAGFKEASDAGVLLEEELTMIARENDMALLGPNCLGIINAHADWNASFAVEKPLPGGIGFVSQSGALGTALLDWATKEGVGISKFVSLGNEASLTEVAFLEHLADDPDTNAVLLYVEKVADGPALLAAVSRITKDKPVVVLRAGRSARGAAAVASHTGSLAPTDAVFDAALRQAGAIPVTSARALFSLAKLFALGYTTPLTRLVILTNGGGPSVNTADLIDLSHSLSLATFDEETRGALRKVLPPMAAVGNPIDVIGDAGPDRYDHVLNTLTTLTDVDAILTIVTPQMMTDPKGIAEVLLKHRAEKPIIPIFMGGRTVTEGIEQLSTAGMPAFHTPSDVVEALEALARHSAKAPEPTPTLPPGPRLSTHLVMYPIEEMQTVLTNYDLPLAGVFARTKDDIAHAVSDLGDGPYAMKAIAASLVHKSDLGAVTLNLTDKDAIEDAWENIEKQVAEHTPGAVIDGMLIQRMVSGIECIVGMKRDPIFGPVIVFGLGGIFVEVLHDSAMRVAPVSKDEARAMIQEIKGYPLLTGARGSTPVNIEALVDVITSLSHLALDYHELEEVDFNPVFATKKGAAIVDARLMRADTSTPPETPAEPAPEE